MSIRFFCVLVILATLASLMQPAFAQEQQASALDERKNVLFLIADDLTATALGCYGNSICQTPHIDALARRGVRFERAYCQYPVCGPSRAALMSGLYPQQIGVLGNGQSRRFTNQLGRRPSFAEWFRRHGYFTARAGKIYHMRVPGDITAGVDGPDHVASWSERYNCAGPEWMSPGLHYQLSNGPLNRDPHRHYGLGFGSSFYVVKCEGRGEEQPDVQAADHAIRMLKQHRNGPFFLAIGFVRPHVPLVAPQAYFQKYGPPTLPLPPRIENDLADIPPEGKRGTSDDRGLDSATRQRQAIAAYYACVSFMDAQVGRILEQLEQLGLRQDTIVVFTSDHGWHLGEHQLWQKQSLHEESARIPLIIAAPGGEAAVSYSLVEQIDLYPTLAQLAGLSIPEHCQGQSLAAVLHDPETSVRNAAYCIRGRNDHLLRTERWAWIQYSQGGVELYDMQNDPYQYTNLANDPAYGQVVNELKERLKTRLAEIQAGK